MIWLLGQVGTSDEAKRDSIYDGEAEGGDAEEEEEARPATAARMANNTHLLFLWTRRRC